MRGGILRSVNNRDERINEKMGHNSTGDITYNNG
jgi:hypothetical protein